MKSVKKQSRVAQGKGTKNRAGGHENPERFDHDALWKDLIERFFYQMLLRAIPTLYRDADTTKPVCFLDKELRQVIKRIGERAKVADYLVDVPLKDGTDTWILLHLEIQGKNGGNLAFRMYHYRSLIFVMYKRPMAALAIITDDRPPNEETYYSENTYETQIDYRYNRLVLKDLNDEELLTSENPLDLALFAAKKSLKHKNDEKRKYLYQKELIRLLKNRNWSQEDRYDLFLFIDRIIALKDENLIEDIRKDGDELWEGEDYMPITTAERAERTYTHRGYRMGIEQGREQGIKRGIEKGIEKGIEQGELKGKQETARNMLRESMEPELIAKFTGLSIEEILALEEKE